MLRLTLRSTLFPYTTLFRSRSRRADPRSSTTRALGSRSRRSTARARRAGRPRSEEHTSELQSRQYLVCRLLLEKKKEASHDSHNAVRDYVADNGRMDLACDG